MSDWIRMKVEDLAAPSPNALATGPFGSSISSKFFVDRGVPVIRGSNLSADVGLRLSDENLVFIEPDKASTFTRSEARRGDLVFTCWGTIGQVGLVDERAAFARYIVSNKQMKLTPDASKADSLFLYFAFSSPAVMAAIQGQSIGSSVPGFNLGQLRNIELDVPPLPEQRRIAAILGALDDKIELNRKMNRTLEEMAQALFKSWFIDFDGHDGLVDSEIGPVPRGWAVVPIAQTGRWVSGGTPSKKNADFWNGTIPWFSAKSLGPLWLADSDERVTEAGADAGMRRVPRRSVLFIVRGMSLATEWRIGMTTREATLNQDLKAIMDDGTVLPELILLWLLVNREAIRAKADEAGHGTKRLPTEVLHAHAMALPTRPIQERMAAPLVHLLARIENNLAESATLAALRDTLLPKLVSGELRVSEAKALVEAAS